MALADEESQEHTCYFAAKVSPLERFLLSLCLWLSVFGVTTVNLIVRIHYFVLLLVKWSGSI